jgi:hypothetical protein
MNNHNKGLRAFRLIAVFAVLMTALGASIAAWGAETATLKEAHQNSDSATYHESESCDPNEDRIAWHFILPGNETTFESLTAEFAGNVFVTAPGPNGTLGPPSHKHAYVYTDSDTTLINATAQVNGPEREFVLSHVCSNEEAAPETGGGETGGGETGGGSDTGGSTGGEAAGGGGTQETGGNVDNNQSGGNTQVLGSTQSKAGGIPTAVLGGSQTRATVLRQQAQVRGALLAATGAREETLAWASAGLLLIVFGLMLTRTGQRALVTS